MDAIETIYLPATNTRGSRVKAKRVDAPSKPANSITVEYDHALNSWDNHRAAAEALIGKSGWTGITFVGGWTGQGTIWVADTGRPQYTIRVIEGVAS